MPKPRIRLLPTTLAVAVAGCATSAIEMAPERPDRPWTPSVRSDGEILPEAAPVSAPSVDNYALPVNSRLAVQPTPSALDSKHAYSLPELIDIAESNNQLTRTAWNNARRAALAAGIAESTYLPKLTANVIAGYQTSHDDSEVLGVDTTDDTTVQGVISAVSAQWLLFDFGERKAVVGAAKQTAVIANIAFTAAHQQLIHDVSLAFYANTAARARVGSSQQSLANAQAVQAAAENRYTQGVGTTVEVAQARQATAQAELLRVRADGAAQDAYLALLTAMGISPLTQIEIADIPQRVLPKDLDDSVERIVTDALGRRPDVLGAHAAQLASEEQVRAAHAEFMPKFFLAATGSYNSDRLEIAAIPSIGEHLPTFNVSGSRYGAILFAGFTVPLYDGGRRAAVLKQAQADADSANGALARTRDEAVRQVVLAANTLRTSLAAYHASGTLVDAANTTFDAALQAYRSGVGSVTDATIAETQLLQAKNSRTDAYSAARAAAATFALAAGRLGSAPQ
jgi:Outer membrane protein